MDRRIARRLILIRGVLLLTWYVGGSLVNVSLAISLMGTIPVTVAR